MSAPAFTPGPWRTGDGDCHGVYVDFGGLSFKLGEFHAKPRGRGSLDSEEDFANARLAAAAPDLLEAAEAVLECPNDRAWELLRNAAEKARGGR